MSIELIHSRSWKLMNKLKKKLVISTCIIMLIHSKSYIDTINLLITTIPHIYPNHQKFTLLLPLLGGLLLVRDFMPFITSSALMVSLFCNMAHLATPYPAASSNTCLPLSYFIISAFFHFCCGHYILPLRQNNFLW